MDRIKLDKVKFEIVASNPLLKNITHIIYRYTERKDKKRQVKKRERKERKQEKKKKCLGSTDQHNE